MNGIIEPDEMDMSNVQLFGVCMWLDGFVWAMFVVCFYCHWLHWITEAQINANFIRIKLKWIIQLNGEKRVHEQLHHLLLHKENCAQTQCSLVHCAVAQISFHLINLARSLSCNLLLNRFKFFFFVRFVSFRRIFNGRAWTELEAHSRTTRMWIRECILVFDMKCRSFWGRSCQRCSTWCSVLVLN